MNLVIKILQVLANKLDKKTTTYISVKKCIDMLVYVVEKNKAPAYVQEAPVPKKVGLQPFKR